VKADRQPGGLGTGLGLGTDAQPGQEHGRKPSGEPNDEATARFERLLAGEAEEPRLRSRAPPPAGPAAPAWAGPAAAPARPAAAPAPAGEGLGRLVEEVAERVLVSDTRFDARGEVRIKVKDSVFPGLEVRLRQVDGRVEVELVATQAGDLLVLRQEARRLLQGLRERLRREVDLCLKVEGPDGMVLASEPVDPAG
jgi:hypothetical protein